jgi:hypothetical protein
MVPRKRSASDLDSANGRAAMSGEASSRTERYCDSCGRRMVWRKAWAAVWPEVRWCSDGCRRRRIKPVDRDLEAAILQLLAERASTATICPSEAARQVGQEQWRDLMEPARAAARRLVVNGEVLILQGSQVVDPSTAKGPIRIRRVLGSSGG